MSHQPKPLTENEIERIRVALSVPVANADFAFAQQHAARAIEQLRGERDAARLVHATFLRDQIQRLDAERIQLQEKISERAGSTLAPAESPE
jgi:hypothetical protein